MNQGKKKEKKNENKSGIFSVFSENKDLPWFFFVVFAFAPRVCGFAGSIMTFLKKVCFIRRFCVVFLRGLGGDVVEIWKDWGSGVLFRGF